LYLLPAELFIDIKSKRSEEELSKSIKINDVLVAVFGEELGSLLYKEAEREDSFNQVNMPEDNMHMAKTDANFPEQQNLKEARRN